MGFYKIISALSPSYSLNLAATTPPVFSDGTNVNITHTAVNSFQNKWYVPSIGNGVPVVSTANMQYRLGADTSSWNCNVRVHKYAALINFVAVSGEKDTYRLQLKNNPTKYLTLEKVELYGNVKWSGLNASNAGQKWVLRETDCTYVYANNWLRMRTTPSATGGRNVFMPVVAPFTHTFNTNNGSVTYSFEFTNKSYWLTAQGKLGPNLINPFAYTQIKAVTGKAPVVKEGTVAALTDEDGRYWIAVGPNVVNPNHLPADIPNAKEMYAHGTLDIVITNNYGTVFYVPAIVGGTKEHTYSNGIIQTWISYTSPNTVYNTGMDFNGVVSVEFINTKESDIENLKYGAYYIEKIQFYPT